MLSERYLIDNLSGCVGRHHVLSSPEDFVTYAFDASAPTEDQPPGFVVLLTSREEVQAVLRLANEHRIPAELIDLDLLPDTMDEAEAIIREADIDIKEFEYALS